MIAVGAVSFVFRLGPLLVAQKLPFSERADHLIRQSGTAAITALIVVSIKKGATGNAALPTTLAIAVAIVLAARGTSMVRLLVVGGGIYACSAIVMQVFTR